MIDKQLDPSHIWFRHQSPHRLNELRPLTYRELAVSRNNPRYVEDRVKEETAYHDVLGSNPSMSFLYSTVVGYHRMTSVDDYPGFTYYFLMSEDEIEEALFGVVSQQGTTTLMRGSNGLINALSYWQENSSTFTSYYDEVLDDYIDPRIEVVSQNVFAIQDFVPQVEDRELIGGGMTLDRLKQLAGLQK